MKINFFLYAFVLFVSTAAASTCSGETDYRAKLQQTDWETAKWTGADQNLKKIRVEIQTSLKAKPQNQWPSFVSLWAAKSKKTPQDASAFFGWATATFFYSSRTGKREHRVLGNLQKRFDQFSQLDSYEFTRIRYLISALDFPSRQLLPVGRRLYQRNRKDYDVAYFLADMLNLRDAEERNEAVGVARQLVILAPTRPSAQASSGWIYFRSWLATRQEEDKSKAIQSYNRYLQLAAKNDSFRPQAQRLIAMMNANR